LSGGRTVHWESADTQITQALSLVSVKEKMGKGMRSTKHYWLCIAAVPVVPPAAAQQCDMPRDETETVACLGVEMRETNQKINETGS